MESALLKSLGGTEDVIVDVSPFDIGRCRTAKLIIPNVNISRKHCRLSYDNLTWVLEDISSSGTFLNDVLIGKGKVTTIKNNDILRLGAKEYNFIWEFKMNKKIDINLETKCYSMSKIFENETKEFRTEMDKKVEEEKKEINEIKKKLIELQDKIIENGEVEEKLKLEIQILQEKMISGKLDLENKFLKEKRRLEEKMIEQQEKLFIENLKARKSSELQERELKDKLKKQEEEKRILMHNLSELEEAKNILSQQLNEFNKIHLLNEARIEEKMQKELIEKEANIKAELREEIECLRKSQMELEYNLKTEFDEEYAKNKDFTKELEGIKTSLNESKLWEGLLERKLKEANSLKEEASVFKSRLLENITELLEIELMCSICSELFVTAVTLNCTHTFCMYCINTWKKKKKNCPICRKKIISENRSIVIDNYIEKMVENLSDDFKCRRKAIITERNEVVPVKKRKMSSSCVISDSSHHDLTSSLQDPDLGRRMVS